ncbi:ATP-binding protein [Vibrio hyugaensis]|uniref:ATP-binding protein n=1 Tax=Vibrio hyugaensis TaxID=1534743 RepID=UPI000CE2ED4D|nr:ATP-binding protein [Vibrio hyugaensis]
MTSKKDELKKVIEQIPSTQFKLNKKNDSSVFLDISKGIAEVIPVRGDKFKKVIRQKAKQIGLRLKQAQVDELVEEFDAIAFENDEVIEAQIRYALSEDKQTVWIDLCNGSIAKLSAGKVALVDVVDDGIYFSRPTYQLPMTMPNVEIDSGGIKKALKQFKSLVNIDTNTFFLLLGYMTYVMSNPKARGVPYPILAIQGEKGCGKSFTCNNVLRGLLDPSSMSGLSLTRKMNDFMLVINSMYLSVFDNLRSLTKEQSDILCTTATNGSTAKRELYSDTQLTVLQLHSPLVLNGIHDYIKESDLASRCVHIKLQPMPEKMRRTEQELKADLEALKPDLFGALLVLSSKILIELESVKVIYSARMMDFAKWLSALEVVLNLPEAQLQKMYAENVKSLMASGTADDSLTIALQKLVKTLGVGEAWQSTPSALLEKLYDFENSQFLPKGAGALSAKLKGQEASLNANGIYLKFGRGSERFVMVSSKMLVE